MATATPLAYLNGRFIPPSSATLPLHVAVLNTSLALPNVEPFQYRLSLFRLMLTAVNRAVLGHLRGNA